MLYSLSSKSGTSHLTTKFSNLDLTKSFCNYEYSLLTPSPLHPYNALAKQTSLLWQSLFSKSHIPDANYICYSLFTKLRITRSNFVFINMNQSEYIIRIILPFYSLLSLHLSIRVSITMRQDYCQLHLPYNQKKRQVFKYFFALSSKLSSIFYFLSFLLYL